jgi:hypothetical protein
MRKFLMTGTVFLILAGCIPMIPLGAQQAAYAPPQGITPQNCAKYRAQLISVGTTPEVADMQAKGVGC